MAQGWERPELGHWERPKGSRWQGALQGIAQPLKTMLSSPRWAKASAPGSPTLLMTQSK